MVNGEWLIFLQINCVGGEVYGDFPVSFLFRIFAARRAFLLFGDSVRTFSYAMKHKSFFRSIIIASLLFASVASLNGQAHAGEYMDKLSSVFDPVRNATWEYLVTVVQSSSSRKSAKKRAELTKFLDESLAKIEQTDTWEGDGSIRDAMANFLRHSTSMLTQDFAEIEKMEQDSYDSFESLDKYLAAQETAQRKYNESAQKLYSTYETFAAAHGVTLLEGEDDELTRKIESAVEAMDYYNQAYRILFKAQIEEAKFIKAIDKMDKEEATVRMANLDIYSKAGKQQVENMGAYQANKVMKINTGLVMDFYQREATQKFPILVEFMKVKDEFDAVKAEIEKTPESKRTNDQINRYNELVNEYNAGVNIFNQTNSELNAERAKLIDGWNARGHEFLQTFINRN